MHEPDLNLLDEAKYALANSREKSSKIFKQDEILNTLITQYEIACELSKGIDKSRSAYWTSEARKRRNKLRAYLNNKETCIGR